jgi:hypothetical protein
MQISPRDCRGKQNTSSIKINPFHKKKKGDKKGIKKSGK